MDNNEIDQKEINLEGYFDNFKLEVDRPIKGNNYRKEKSKNQEYEKNI